METKNLNVDDFELKTEGSDIGIFTGYGSTFGGQPDSYGDIVEKGAFLNTIKKGGRNGTGVAMLWQHSFDRPIGTWSEMDEDSKGLKVRGQLAIKSTDGSDMFELMKIKAVKSLSIGYDTVSYETDEKKQIRNLKEVNLWEISPVVFPANTRATITNVKSMIEDANNERELEHSLRDAGLSNSASKFIVSLCKDKLFERKSKKQDYMIPLFKCIHEINEQIKN